MTAPLDELGRDELRKVLATLLRRYPELAAEAESLARSLLAGVDVQQVADEVFCDIRSLDVRSAWSQAGDDDGCGYRSAEDVAYEMLEDAVSPHLRDMQRQHRQGLVEAASETCLGVIAGLCRYEEDPEDHEFSDWVPDGPTNLAEEALGQWTHGARSRPRLSDRAELAATFPVARLDEVAPGWAGQLRRGLRGCLHILARVYRLDLADARPVGRSAWLPV